jgi:hypothetical protein
MSHRILVHVSGGFVYFITKDFEVDIRASVRLNPRANDFLVRTPFAIEPGKHRRRNVSSAPDVRIDERSQSAEDRDGTSATVQHQ